MFLYPFATRENWAQRGSLTGFSSQSQGRESKQGSGSGGRLKEEVVWATRASSLSVKASPPPAPPPRTQERAAGFDPELLSGLLEWNSQQRVPPAHRLPAPERMIALCTPSPAPTPGCPRTASQLLINMRTTYSWKQGQNKNKWKFLPYKGK